MEPINEIEEIIYDEEMIQALEERRKRHMKPKDNKHPDPLVENLKKDRVSTPTVSITSGLLAGYTPSTSVSLRDFQETFFDDVSIGRCIYVQNVNTKI